MKVILLVISIFMLTACDKKAEHAGTVTSGGVNFDRICIDGVEYLTLSRGRWGYMSPHIKTDGSIYTCGDKK